MSVLEVAGDPPAATRWHRDPRRRPLLVAGVVAVVLSIAYLAAGRMGGDLSAQLAHADFARDHPLTPVDLRWFGGIQTFGYSLYVPFLAAWVGTELLGVLAAVAGSVLTAAVFVRTGVRRPAVGGALAACCQVANLTEGRVAFAVGLAVALVAVLALTAGSGRHRVVVVVAAVLAGAGSPVAALLLGVVAVALFVHGRRGDAVLLAVGAGVGIAVVSLLFGDGGAAVFNPVDAVRAAAASVLVALVTPRRFRVLRTGAVVGVVMVVVAFALDTPVGGNASRLALLFAIPVVGAVTEWRAVRAALAVVVAVVVQTPVTFGTLAAAGDPPTQAAYYAPLVTRLEQDGPLAGRVEIPELVGHWEAVYVARHAPLARGWLRQADTELNGDVFYRSGPPTADAYRDFLQRTATAYVAIPQARLGFYGKREADLVRGGLPYLRQVWSNSDWTLWAVDDPRPVVAAPATDVRLGAAAIGFDAPADSVVTVEVRWLRWLSLESADDPSACVEPGAGDTSVQVRTRAGGSYRLTSSLVGEHRHCG